MRGAIQVDRSLRANEPSLGFAQLGGKILLSAILEPKCKAQTGEGMLRLRKCVSSLAQAH